VGCGAARIIDMDNKKGTQETAYLGNAWGRGEE